MPRRAPCLLTGLLVIALTGPALARTAGAEPARPGHGFTADTILRPLRYTPQDRGFVITNGPEFFNRPLYGAGTAYRVDGGDKPEFSLYLPGRGGNLRLGLRAGGQIKWLNDAAQVVARYRAGALIHEVRDPLLGDARLRVTAVVPAGREGLILQAEVSDPVPGTELVWAFGGVDGLKGRRNGDIGCEAQPVGKMFQLRADECAGNRATVDGNTFQVRGQPGTIRGVVSAAAETRIADAGTWNHPQNLFSPAAATRQPLVAGRVPLPNGAPFYLALQFFHADHPTATEPSAAGLPQRFAEAAAARRAVAEQVRVDTPDPFVDASVAALNVAADAVWDDRQKSFMHGAVAWRVRLLGWRGPYAGDELGWHDRTIEHFSGYARQQNTGPVPEPFPAPEESANLARNENALHSNGDLSNSHYDMNLAGVDAFFRHLLWTGDLACARREWPVLERHLAWERRLFRRPFGSDALPLYEAYCCIWASDDLAYNGGGATHSSALNYYHNRQAARVAKLIGQDPAPYENEARLISEGMRKYLWLGDRGWFGEGKDWLGRQDVNPAPAVWTFYHTVDCEVPTPLEAWQMSRFVDTQIAHFPLRGPGVPEGNCTVATTDWLPYQWSLNNVVLAETMHTALGYWQAGRPESAFALYKGAVLDSMYLGLCPGNVGMTTWFDATRRETQRDFADGAGTMSRSVVEGLFGVRPDLLAGTVTVHPGFPPGWDHAAIAHPDFDFAFHREPSGDDTTYTFTNRFPQPARLILQIPARRDSVAAISVNGKPAAWKLIDASVGFPLMEVTGETAREQVVQVRWQGRSIDPQIGLNASVLAAGEPLTTQFGPAEVAQVMDPQGALTGLTAGAHGFTGQAAGTPGQRTVFAQLRQGAMAWWQPVSFTIRASAPAAAFDWTQPVPGPLEPADLSRAFNDRVTQIFQNQYRSPRSPFCSLAIPQQGTGSWCHPTNTLRVDDSGLRRAAGKADGKIVLPNGVPLVTPAAPGANNIAFVSQWDNYPRELSVPLAGKSSRAFLLMAGSTSALQSRVDNGEVVVTYTDGTTARLALQNPTTWWPIDQDYYFDDFAFNPVPGGGADGPPPTLPVRVDLATGNIRVLRLDEFKGRGRGVPGGAATVLQLPLDPAKQLKSLTVRALANEVVIGLMSVTLAR